MHWRRMFFLHRDILHGTLYRRGADRIPCNAATGLCCEFYFLPKVFAATVFGDSVGCAYVATAV